MYHKERNLFKFFLQRFSFGLDVTNIMNFQNKISSFQPLLPSIVFFDCLFLLIFEVNKYGSFLFTFYLFIFIQMLILINLLKYIQRVDKIFFTLICINLANIFYAVGSFFNFLKLDKIFQRNSYRLSRKNN